MVSTTLALRAIWGMLVCVTTFPVRFVWTSGRGCNNGSNAMRLCEGSVVYPAQSIAGNGSLRVAGVAAFGGYGYTPRGTRVRRDGKGQGRVGMVWMVPRYFCSGHPSLTSFFFAAVCVRAVGRGGALRSGYFISSLGDGLSLPSLNRPIMGG